MSWTDDYIGIPFKCDGRDRSGLDCGGLVMLVYKEMMGVDLPAFSGTLKDLSLMALRRASTAIRAGLSLFEETDRPAQFDLVASRRGGIQACHIGIVCSRHEMLHVEHGINSAIESFKAPLWEHKVTGFFRYVG